MAKPQKNPRITFNGKFTSEIRQRLREKRHELGLPFHVIAEFFDVNWSTFRKWETGETMHCTNVMRPMLEDFINGDYDEALANLVRKPILTLASQPPERVCQALETVANTYTLCAKYPTLAENLIRKVELIAQETLRDLVSAKPQKKR